MRGLQTTGRHNGAFTASSLAVDSVLFTSEKANLCARVVCAWVMYLSVGRPAVPVEPGRQRNYT